MITVRKAKIDEAPGITHLVNHYAAQGLMLPKTLLSVYDNVRDFVVAVEDDGTIVGCGALRVMWHDLAEVRSLAIHESVQGQGVGRRLVDALIEEARVLGLARVFALTYQRVFFEKLGFTEVTKDIFPQKVWLDCTGCPKQACCDEIAMLMILDAEKAARGESESKLADFARAAKLA